MRNRGALIGCPPRLRDHSRGCAVKAVRFFPHGLPICQNAARPNDRIAAATEDSYKGLSQNTRNCVGRLHLALRYRTLTGIAIR
jgi:hypothetical protein